MCFFLGNIYSRGLKFLQVIYENFDCDLTHGFLIRDFNKYLFYDDINPNIKSQSKIYVIIEKIFIEIMNKKIRVLNHKVFVNNL